MKCELKLDKTSWSFSPKYNTKNGNGISVGFISGNPYAYWSNQNSPFAILKRLKIKYEYKGIICHTN